jgi:hypothetical protein
MTVQWQRQESSTSLNLALPLPPILEGAERH